jgi:hypothetical protein
MPVKTDSEKTLQEKTVDSPTHEEVLSKRVIQMPDGRYMIFYTDKDAKAKQGADKA